LKDEKKLVNVNNLNKMMKEKTSLIFNKALQLEDYFVNFFIKSNILIALQRNCQLID